ncbi:MAG: iron uptake porin, partial [Gloeobacterales cyanobacterium]
MKKFVLMGALAATLSLSLVPSAFAEPNSAVAEPDSTVIDQYSKGLGADSVSQVSSVSELTDVDPNSWAFQALKSLVERYGCIEGYPNKKYLGNRPLSRYEFAAGLNSCLDKIGEQIAAAVADKATKDDLAAVQRLQEEFKVELATLRGRVDALEAKTKELEAQQFSTTTKLDGSVVMAIQGGSAGGNVQISPTSYTTTTPFVGVNGGVVPAGTVLSTSINGYGPATFGNVLPGFPATAGGVGSLPGLTANNLINLPGSSANTTFFGRTTLNFRASFTGKDELLIRLRGVTGQDIGGTFQGIAGGLGTAFYAGGPNGAYDQSSIGNVQTNGNSNVSFDKVRYTTTLFSDNFR